MPRSRARKLNIPTLLTVVTIFMLIALLFKVRDTRTHEKYHLENRIARAATVPEKLAFAHLRKDILAPDAIPSETVTNETERNRLTKERTKNQVHYGGGGTDPVHLGGFVENDTDTWEPLLWDWIIREFEVHSVLDVGCGMGYSTHWFSQHKSINKTRCIEGSSDGVEKSIVPSLTVHHDYALGPYWTSDFFDMVWSAEFLEHVDEEFMANYMATFQRARIVLVTHAVWGGWHHSNVHRSPWWIARFLEYGFQYLPDYTKEGRKLCCMGAPCLNLGYPAKRFMSHFRFRGLIFLNTMLKSRTELERMLNV